MCAGCADRLPAGLHHPTVLRDAAAAGGPAVPRQPGAHPAGCLRRAGDGGGLHHGHGGQRPGHQQLHARRRARLLPRVPQHLQRNLSHHHHTGALLYHPSPASVGRLSRRLSFSSSVESVWNGFVEGPEIGRGPTDSLSPRAWGLFMLEVREPCIVGSLGVRRFCGLLWLKAQGLPHGYLLKSSFWLTESWQIHCCLNKKSAVNFRLVDNYPVARFRYHHCPVG